MNKIRITRMTVDHLPAIVEIEKAVFPDPWSYESFVEAISLSEKCWIAQKGPTVIGYLITQWVMDEIHILNVAVSPDRQRQGVGAALLEYLLDIARQSGMRDVYLEVRMSNQAAQALYTKYAFAQLAVRKRYYRDGEDARVMHRSLISLSPSEESEDTGCNDLGMARQSYGARMV
ncbi:ribosomal protein S18-alanine N-acetyltransferase [bacterium]|nr:ribosomal protein S18-alanine N-acetyltransferase [bacterium]